LSTRKIHSYLILHVLRLWITCDCTTGNARNSNLFHFLRSLAVAEDTFERIRLAWDQRAPEESNLPPLERLRAEYRALFWHTAKFPEFHRFMRQEAAPGNPRLQWVAENVLEPLINRLLPQIKAAQAEGQLPPVEPMLFHYMMVSLSAALSEFGPEMRITRRLSADRPEVAEAYWTLVEETVFGAPRATRSSRAA